ncbi:MAG: four-carbon acid sugar kinase family protein [Geminicoccaceae bacterium]|nr:four-carbon acid sugar kinase family protein [Geminicoccaceae bacterium]MCX8100295.1 four-carbon acid sugar kinase family protein [Geminicoccaceae bacterium]MDW8370321.1 four-carbon acid sugar kinase family protein [Geminicoccaceae bacterium]
MPLLLGAIADDFTGATDLCNMLVRNGMRTVQLIGVPRGDLELDEVDAITIALKSRTVPAKEAVALSLEALEWLQRQRARQVFFKYCSTFDSTPEGNIGPVGDALADRVDAAIAIACPAFPETGRTIYMGHLFVGDRLLSETHMAHHPLTPMTDPDLVRVLGRQTPRKVGLVAWPSVRRGAAFIRDRLTALRHEGFRWAIVDCLEDADLLAIGEAVADHPLVTGGSGVAMGLPANFRRQGLLPERGAEAAALPPVPGPALVLAGSCSAATLGQIEAFREHRPARRLDPLALAKGEEVREVIAWAREHLPTGPVLIYASAPPEEVRRVQERLGRDRAGAVVEEAMAAIARELVASGVRRLVVAGGETSGAVVKALAIEGLAIGPQIDPGVPATVTIGRGPRLALALKSGNFGRRDFFLRALEAMP